VIPTSRRIRCIFVLAAQNFEVFSKIQDQNLKMSFSRPIQLYHSHADPIWPDGTFKSGEGIGKGRSEAEREVGPKERSREGG
jgi:hypothetical protein